MDEESKKSIIHGLNLKIGNDVEDLSGAYDRESFLAYKKNDLLKSVSFS